MLFLGSLVLPTGIAAADQPTSIFQDGSVAALHTNELHALRGGFVVAGDFLIEFGGVVRAFSGDTLIFENTFSVGGDGTLETNPTLAEQGPDGQTWLLLNDPDAQSVMAGNLSSLAVNHGVILNQNGRFTALLHDIGQGNIAGFAINSASGMNVRQEIEIDIGVANFHDFADQAALSQQVRNVTESAVQAAINSVKW